MEKTQFVQEVKQLFAVEKYVCYERKTEMQDIYNYLTQKKRQIYTTDVIGILYTIASEGMQYIQNIRELEKDVYRRIMQSKGQITPAISKKIGEMHTYIQGAAQYMHKRAQQASGKYVVMLPYEIRGVLNLKEVSFAKMHTQCFILRIWNDQLTKDLIEYFESI